MTTQHEIWVFFLQGFHFHQHKFQTVVTFILSIGIAGLVASVLGKLWDRGEKPFIPARISVEEWQSFKELADATTKLVEGAGKLSVAASNTSKAAQEIAASASADAIKALQANDIVAFSVGALTKSLGALAAQIQRLEMSPVHQVDAQGAAIPADFKVFQLEVSNTLDELREEIRLFKEDIEGRLTMIEFEASEAKAETAIVEGLAEINESTLGLKLPDDVVPLIPPKRGRGRPIGSKNKKKSRKKK